MGTSFPFLTGEFMKRSNMVLGTSLLAITELIMLGVMFNEKFRFIESTLEFKYQLVCFITYVCSTGISFIHLVMNYDDHSSTKKENYLKTFGKEHVNFMFTYHFLIFAVLCFYLNAWLWCIMGCLMFWIHNYIHRDNQNNYSLMYAIEEANISARAPVVLNNSDYLL